MNPRSHLQESSAWGSVGLETGSAIESALQEEPDLSVRTEPRGGLNSREELNRENQVLRDRVSGLSAASMRISADLDPATVLSEVVECASSDGRRSGGCGYRRCRLRRTHR